MTPTSLFEILRRKEGIGNRSGKFSSATIESADDGTVTQLRGTPLGAHATDPDSFILADADNFLGFMTRDVKKAGMSTEDRVFGTGATSATPVAPDTPFTDGLEVSVEPAEEIECEGASFVQSGGTGDITAATAVNAGDGSNQLSLLDGLWRTAQSGEPVLGLLTANNLTPLVTGQLRIRIKMLV